jgi:hypothetical protein
MALALSDDGWRHAVHYANGHGVAMLLRARLSAAGADPGPQAEALGAVQFIAGVRALETTRETARLLDLLRSAGIDAIAIKGPGLGKLAYGDAALRSYGDIDILVPMAELEEAGRVLIAAGLFHHLSESGHTRSWWQRSKGQLPRLRGAGEHEVEVHGSIHPPYFKVGDQPGLRRRAVSEPVDGFELRIPSREDSLIIVSGHAMRSGWKRLEWLTSLAWLSHDDRIDWELVEEVAQRTGTARMLSVGLRAAVQLLELDLPDAAANLVEPNGRSRAGDRLLLAVTTRLESPVPFDPNTETDGPVSFERGVEHLRARERIRDRAAYLTHFVLVPTAVDAAVVELPGLVGAVGYRLVRWTRLLKRAVRVALSAR